MEISELEAYEAIRNLIVAYNSFGDRGKFDQLVDLFTVDAAMDIGDDRIYQGINQIKSIFTSTSASVSDDVSISYIHHHTSSPLIELEAEKNAQAKTYFSVYMDHGLDHWGRYEDKFEIRDKIWFFTHRKVRTDGWVPNGWASNHLGKNK